MKTLYQEVEAKLNDHLPLDWHSELRRRLLLLVMGIVLSESCSPRQMAQALYQHGLSTAQEESIARQIRRIENDDRLTVETCLHPFAKHHLCFGKPQELILIMDATTHTDKIVVLMVSVRYRGRALPVAWQVWLANQPLQGLGFWLRVSQLLAQVACILPQGIAVTWLADRAFGTPQFTDLLQAYGWHFIVRVQGQTRFADRMGYEHRLDQISGKRQRFKGCGKVFKAAKWRDLNVVVLHSRSCLSPLCLVTDLDPDWSIARTYRLRYNIEAMFRDYKSYGWHWEQSQVTDIDHSQRLLLGMALATWLTLMLGTQVAHEYLSQVPTGKRRTSPVKQSLFQLGLQRLKQWAVGNFRHPLAFWLTGWHFPNWDDHIAQHHLFAYVMGTKSSFVKVQLYLYSTVRL